MLYIFMSQITTPCFSRTSQSEPKDQVWDSNTGRKCYGNPAYCDMVKTKVPDLSTSTIVFTSVSVYEINKRVECGFDELHSQLESAIDSEILIQKITYGMKELGLWLRDHMPVLHIPDDQILAYAMLTNSVLITCDKGLEEAAKLVNQDVINPDRTIIEYAKIRTSFSKLAQNKVNQIKQKMPVLAPTTPESLLDIFKKSAGKITWETFA